MTAATSWLSSLKDAPMMPRASCIGRANEFDAAEPGELPRITAKRYRQAVDACQACPELGMCAAWLATLKPAQKPFGVTAGQIREYPTNKKPRQPRKETA